MIWNRLTIISKSKVSCVIRNNGQATVEFLVSLAFFVPLIIGIPLLGKYSDLKQKNIEASRYAVWERTIWSDPAIKWNDGIHEVSKTGAQIRDEMDLHFYGNPIQGLRQKQKTDNPLWEDRKGSKMIKVNANKERVSLALGESDPGFNTYLVDDFAFKGVPLLSNLGTVTNILNNTIAKLVTDCKNIPGVDFSHGMNLGYRSFATATVTTTANNFTIVKGDLNFIAKAGILSNAWTAPDEATYRQRVGNLVFDESVRCLAAPSRLVSWLPVIFREGKNAVKVQGPASTRVLLPEYK